MPQSHVVDFVDTRTSQIPRLPHPVLLALASGVPPALGLITGIVGVFSRALRFK